MRLIPLTQGKFAKVDDADYQELISYNWIFNNGYAFRHLSLDRSTGKRSRIMMHRQLMNTPKGMDTDHINRDRLDNRRSNLRVCTRSQNMANKGLKSNNTTGYAGVSLTMYRRTPKKYQARISYEGRVIHLGYSNSKLEAYKLYKKAHKELFKDFSPY